MLRKPKPLEVRLPDVPFRLNPDPTRRARSLLLAQIEVAYYMVAEAALPIAQQHGLNLFHADLIEGVMEDGTTFLFPVVRPVSGANRASRSLAEAAEIARHKWIWIEPDERAQLFRKVYGWRSPATIPRWSSETHFPTLVADAFDHRYIDPDYFVRRHGFMNNIENSCKLPLL